MTDDEMNENQDFAPEGEELADETSRISEFKSQVAQKDEALASASARITELEQAIGEVHVLVNSNWIAQNTFILTQAQVFSNIERLLSKNLTSGGLVFRKDCLFPGITLTYSPLRGEYEERLLLGAV